MKKTFDLLAATTALSAAISAPAWSAMRTGNGEFLPFAAVLDADQDAIPMSLASSDDEDDREYRNGVRYEDDDDDDDCEDDECGSSASTAAPAGNIAPPQNGLFGNGSAPKVQMN